MEPRASTLRVATVSDGRVSHAVRRVSAKARTIGSTAFGWGITMNALAQKPLALTMGDPAGVGPEIVAKALAHDAVLRGRVVVVGDPLALADALTRYAQHRIMR